MDGIEFILRMKIIVACTTFSVLVEFYVYDSFVSPSSSFIFPYSFMLKCRVTLFK